MNRRVYLEVDLLFDGDDPYYDDFELPHMAESWIDSALNDRSDLIGWKVNAFQATSTEEEYLS